MKLIQSNGSARFGIFAEPIEEVNHRDFPLFDEMDRRVGWLRRRFAFNQFEFLGGISEQLVFGCAVADVKYAGTAFVYAYDPATRWIIERSFQRPLAAGLWFDQQPESGTTEFRSGRDFIQMRGTIQPRTRHLEVHLRDGFEINATFAEETTNDNAGSVTTELCSATSDVPGAKVEGPGSQTSPLEPMRICTPAGGSGFVFARNTAGHRITGTLRVNGRKFDLAEIGALGHHDWTAGYMRRHTFWNWGCIAGHATDGRVVGMNVSCGVNETSFSENCFWLNGRLHQVGPVLFQYNRTDVMLPWRMTSIDGRVDLRFVPEAAHRERVHAILVATNFTQLIGRYDGTLRTEADETLRIESQLGYAERHYAKW